MEEKGWGAGRAAPILALSFFGPRGGSPPPHFPSKLEEYLSGCGLCGWPHTLVGTHMI